jgi:hypothetical protein
MSLTDTLNHDIGYLLSVSPKSLSTMTPVKNVPMTLSKTKDFDQQ